MENHTLGDIVGSSDAPYLTQLANRCGLATAYFAESHPSLPNYIALVSGTTAGIHDDASPSAHPLSLPTIFSELGSDWRVLAQSMPSACDRNYAGAYYPRHNPAVYFTNIRSACLNQDVPLTDPPDLSARFTMVVPDACHDMHQCSQEHGDTATIRAGDAFMASELPKLVATPEYQSGSTVIFIVWDEGDGSNQRVPLIVIAPQVRAGTRVGVTLNHYALLRGTEELLGLPTNVGNAGNSGLASLRSAFGL
jgi:phospholipase C